MTGSDQLSTQDLSKWDSRKLSKEAPTGTPSPLREAYEAVAEAVFHAWEARYLPNDNRFVFEDAIAVPLSNAWRSARRMIAENKIWLRSQAPVAFDHFQKALDEVAQINDACGHVMLGAASAKPTVYLAAQRPFNSYVLMDGMENATCNAVHRLSQGQAAKPDQPDGNGAVGSPAQTQRPTEWTKPALPSYWAGIFECDVRTLRAMIEKRKIVGDIMSTKRWRIAIDSLPAKEKNKHRGAK